MNDTDSGQAGRGAARRRSDLAVISAWWRGLGGDGFVVLPPPGRGRYTQSDGHTDAAELIGARGLGGPVSFAYWHWQSHGRAFDRAGALTGGLLLHWGGDHAVVAAGLGAGPAGFRVVDGGPQGAFQLDRITRRDDDGLPDPADPDGVRQFLAALDEPVRRGPGHVRHRPLSPAEAAWLRERLDAAQDLADATRFAVAPERRDGLTSAQALRLLRAWREEYDGRLAHWTGWREVLHALLRHGREEAWETVAALGPGAAGVVADVPSERGLAVVRAYALAGAPGTAFAWLKLHRAVHEPDAVRAVRALAAELDAHDAPEAALRGLAAALTGAVAADRRAETGASGLADRSYAGLLAVRFATDERLPRALRVLVAQTARDHVELVHEAAHRAGAAPLPGTDGAPPTATAFVTDPAEALAAIARYEAARDGLLSGTGPDLTAPEGVLGRVWHRYRTLTEGDVRWLRERIADPDTDLQGLGFCLELLYAHGLAGPAEVEALLPRRMKDLTKKYRTTYTEWRHPLVTLTCLALDLGHPAAEKLLSWWDGPRPVWKNELRLLTHLGAPDESKAAALWEFVTSRAHDVGQLTTWVLVRARLDGVHPLFVADRLLGTPGVHEHKLRQVLVGVADAGQPLWHYAVDGRSRGWWQRAQEVAEHPGLSPAARAIGVRTAREHCLVRYPDQLNPPPTEAERAAALEWVRRHDDG
ncbi:MULTISPECIES: hypothetical protein [Streptomyces]|uniref:Uncharacterized protein n=2 Tax=Streptomyces TaxID=1883 RepID=A0ABU4KHP3_9ACTN|nr:hypothetical protein [Streptomyces roseolus]MDX2297330.1 hypothetical protein [Streptomyces roseolus]